MVNSLNELIEALEARAIPVQIGSKDITTPTDCVELSTVIDLITTLSETHVLAPKEPTVLMNNAGNEALTEGYQQGMIQSSDIYRAMLSSAGVSK